jgi:hypothetical protein
MQEESVVWVADGQSGGWQIGWRCSGRGCGVQM